MPLHGAKGRESHICHVFLNYSAPKFPFKELFYYVTNPACYPLVALAFCHCEDLIMASLLYNTRYKISMKTLRRLLKRNFLVNFHL